MESLIVECLRCGCSRKAEASPLRHANPECPRCGYLGWAHLGAVSDRERRPLRSRVLDLFRLRLA
jgi:hypothetical protein